MKRGEKIIKTVEEYLKNNKDIDESKYIKIFRIIQPFIEKFDSEDLDIRTISKLETLLGFDLVIIPTKQQWRKLKLENINKNRKSD